LALGKIFKKPGDAHGRPVEKSTAHPPGPACILRRRPPARPEQKNEKDAHPPDGRVSQIGRVGARPALSVVLEPAVKASLSLKVKLDLIEISSLELAVRANDSTIARRR